LKVAMLFERDGCVNGEDIQHGKVFFMDSSPAHAVREAEGSEHVLAAPDRYIQYGMKVPARDVISPGKGVVAVQLFQKQWITGLKHPGACIPGPDHSRSFKCASAASQSCFTMQLSRRIVQKQQCRAFSLEIVVDLFHDGLKRAGQIMRT